MRENAGANHKLELLPFWQVVELVRNNFTSCFGSLDIGTIRHIVEHTLDMQMQVEEGK